MFRWKAIGVNMRLLKTSVSGTLKLSVLTEFATKYPREAQLIASHKDGFIAMNRNIERLLRELLRRKRIKCIAVVDVPDTHVSS